MLLDRTLRRVDLLGTKLLDLADSDHLLGLGLDPLRIRDLAARGGDMHDLGGRDDLAVDLDKLVGAAANAELFGAFEQTHAVTALRALHGRQPLLIVIVTSPLPSSSASSCADLPPMRPSLVYDQELDP